MNPTSKNNEEEYEPIPNPFFPDDLMLPPRKMREYGYRLAKGMPYRLYSLTEFKELIKDGRALPIKKRPTSEKYVYLPGDEIPAQIALLNTAKRSRYVREMLKRNIVTLSWDEEHNRPKISYSKIATKDETNHP